MSPFRQGLILGNRYTVDVELGRGGMGSVGRGIDWHTREPVALKLLDGLRATEPARRRFLREARTLDGLRHPHIVAQQGVLDHEGVPVLVMELLCGKTLRARLDREERLPLGAAASILMQVSDAMAFAHRAGVVHRDLKPDNVFLHNDVGGAQVRVLDFGIAKLTADAGTLISSYSPRRHGGTEIEGDLMSDTCLHSSPVDGPASPAIRPIQAPP